ncbi:flagellar basal-body rod protein FlgF [Bacillaceae bacterium]
MIRGLTTAALGMMAQQRRQDALAHNLANVETPGYKQVDAVLRAFPEYLIRRMHDQQPANGNLPYGMPSFPGQAPAVGSLYNGVYAQETIPRFGQGGLVETGQALDVAIVDQDLPPVERNGRTVRPAVLFAVRTPEGEIRYTRNGKWQVDEAGRVVTASGDQVLLLNDREETVDWVLSDPNMDLREVQIAADGRIIINGQDRFPDPQDPTRLTTLRLFLVRADDPYQLVPEGNGLYRWEGAADPDYLGAGDFAAVSVRQGYIEKANVDPAKTVAEMMMVLRAYEANQKVIQAYDRTLEKLVNEVGRVNG